MDISEKVDEHLAQTIFPDLPVVFSSSDGPTDLPAPDASSFLSEHAELSAATAVPLPPVFFVPPTQVGPSFVPPTQEGPSSPPSVTTVGSNSMNQTPPVEERDKSMNTMGSIPELPPVLDRNGQPFGSMKRIVDAARQKLSRDKICRTRPIASEEMVIFSHLSQTSPERTLQHVPCVVDTACGLGYLIAPKKSQIRFSIHPCREQVELADGSIEQIHQFLYVNMTIANTTHRCQLLVLKTQEDSSELSVLFGRYLIELFGINTVGAHRVTLGKQVLFEARRDCIRRILEPSNADFSTGEDGHDGLVTLPTPELVTKTASEYVKLSVSEPRCQLLDLVLHELSLCQPQPLPRCPGRITLRRLSELDPDQRPPLTPLDTPEQVFSFFLSLDHDPVFKEHPRLYASSMFHRLSPEDQERFRSQVNDYVSVSWWIPADPGSAARYGPPANVFCVRQKSGKKLRPVIDFRQRNKAFPSTSSNPLISFSIALLRTVTTGVIHVADAADAASAFSHIRTELPAWVHAGPIGNFLSRRVSFGMSYGPESLGSSLGTLWALHRELTTPSTGAEFVDDCWIHEDISPTATSEESGIAELLYLWSRCGFGVEKKKFQRAPVPGGSIDLLGLAITFDCTSGGNPVSVIRCRREELKLFPFDDLFTKPTKSMIFKLCGSLAYDAAREHLDAKIVSDLLRSVVGRYGVDKASWTAPLKIDDFIEVDRTLYFGLVEWAKEIVLSQGECHHIAPIPIKQDRLRLQVSTDASHAGGGFVIRFSPDGKVWHSIWKDAWLWKKAALGRHSNRLEGDTLYRGLRTTAKFLSFVAASRRGGLDIPVDLSILSDNSTAIAWAEKPPGPSVGYEARAIERLSQGLRVEAHYLRSICKTFSITHVPGRDNVDADSLSRLLERRCGSETLHVLLKKRNALLRKRKDDEDIEDIVAPFAEEPMDHVRRVTDLPDPVCLAEDLARSCYDMEDAIDLWGACVSVLRAWKASTTHSPETYGTHSVAESTTHSNEAYGTHSVAESTTQSIEPNGTHSVAESTPHTEHYWSFFRNLQQACNMDKFQQNPFHMNTHGVIVHCHRTAFGESVSIVVVPRNTATARRIVLTVHRRGLHRGIQHTAALISKKYYLECRQAVVSSVLRSCTRCAFKNAHVQWSKPTEVANRDIELPVLTRVCIDHMFIDKNLPVLSVMCIDTGFLALSRCNSTSAADSVEALLRVCTRYSVSLQLIRCDQGSCFTSSIFCKALKSAGQNCELSFTAAGAPYTNPTERLHREVWSIIRSTRFVSKIAMDVSSDKLQESLDQIACCVNSRPIGYYLDNTSGAEDILTPAVLAFGGRGTGSSLKGIREYFYTQCFQRLRRVYQNSTVNQRRGRLIIGQRALLFVERAPKSVFPFKLCRIIDIIGSDFIIRIIESGEQRRVGSNQLAPLHLPSLTKARSPTDVDRTGARISSDFDGTKYLGTVVADFDDSCEIQWDAVGDTTWHNEILPWGACRILDAQ